MTMTTTPLRQWLQHHDDKTMMTVTTTPLRQWQQPWWRWQQHHNNNDNNSSNYNTTNSSCTRYSTDQVCVSEWWTTVLHSNPTVWAVKQAWLAPCAHQVIQDSYTHQIKAKLQLSDQTTTCMYMCVCVNMIHMHRLLRKTLEQTAQLLDPLNYKCTDA
jgi:hypothetical protein